MSADKSLYPIAKLVDGDGYASIRPLLLSMYTTLNSAIHVVPRSYIYDKICWELSTGTPNMHILQEALSEQLTNLAKIRAGK